MAPQSVITAGIRNLVFDFGGVLLDIDIRRTVEAFRRLGLAGLNPAEIHPQNTGIFLDLELGTVSEEAFVARLQSCAAGGLPVPTREQLLDAWNALLSDYDWRRFELLDRLRRRGYKIFLLSNTNRPHRECFIRKFDRENPAGRPFESYFDRCFYSDVLHLRKPDPAIYRTVLREAGIEAGETLFIDDNRPNTDAAAELGFQTVHLVPPATIFDLFA